MINLRLIVAGFGNVGRNFIKLLCERHSYISNKYGVSITVCSVGDSGGFVYKPDGFDWSEIDRFLQCPRGQITKLGIGFITKNIKDVFEIIQPDVLVELTPANYETGEPGLTYTITALRFGIHVITANKAPLVLKFKELHEIAYKRKVGLKYRGTVFGGVPVLDFIQKLDGQIIKRIEGILNATTNYILTRVFKDGLDIHDAIEEAKKIGIMEANPALDLEGIDAAAKLVIIANVLGLNLTLDKIIRKGITELTSEEVNKLRKQEKIVKLIAELIPEQNIAKVEPKILNKDHDLAKIDYTLNALRIETDSNTILIKGKGGGGIETASNVLSDLIDLIKEYYTR